MEIARTEIAYQEQLAGNTALYIFPLCVLFVSLVHSAEYESCSLRNNKKRKGQIHSRPPWKHVA